MAPSLTHGLAQGLACWPDEIGTLERLAAENFAGIERDARRHTASTRTSTCRAS